VLIGLFGWQAIFAVNVPLAVAAVALAWVWVPRDEPVARTHTRLDLRGVFSRPPILRTYLRQALAFLAIYAILFGYVQWLEAGRGLNETGAGLLLLPMSLVAVCAAAASGRATGVRARLTLSAVGLGGGSALLLTVTASAPVALLVGVAAVFGLAQGLTSVTNQTVLYGQAQAQLIGTASGLFRTAQYLGATGASGLIALCFGGGPDDAGLHRLALALLVVAVLLLALTLPDRALRQRQGTRIPHREPDVP
jgi:predicted MFS family arabinose efflux permease